MYEDEPKSNRKDRKNIKMIEKQKSLFKRPPVQGGALSGITWGPGAQSQCIIFSLHVQVSEHLPLLKISIDESVAIYSVNQKRLVESYELVPLGQEHLGHVNDVIQEKKEHIKRFSWKYNIEDNE